MRPTVFLFDIDGTLLTCGGAGRRSMEGAFRDALGTRGVSAVAFSFGGMTDRAIIRAGLLNVGVEALSPAIDRLLEAYLTRLEDEVVRSGGYRVHPGVAPLLAWLSTIERAAVGLGTGNVRRGAYAKLARGALADAFPFGGFGCDAEERSSLLGVGAARGADALGAPLAECRVVVIGDTPKDVAAARAIGADCVGVGTGGFEPPTLRALGALAAFPTLEDDGVRDALLGRLTSP
jgi:phosphoglycolate phosphatase-like HAD superfamily hydrolase